MNTTEILQAEAPEALFFLAAANDLRKLVKSHAQALVKLAEREWKPIDSVRESEDWILVYEPANPFYAPRVI